MEFILNVTYTMKPGLRAEFLREVSEHGIQKAVLAEEGCLQYQYFEAVDEPDKLLLVERWTERKAQEVHMTQGERQGGTENGDATRVGGLFQRYRDHGKSSDPDGEDRGGGSGGGV